MAEGETDSEFSRSVSSWPVIACSGEKALVGRSLIEPLARKNSGRLRSTDSISHKIVEVMENDRCDQ